MKSLIALVLVISTAFCSSAKEAEYIIAHGMILMTSKHDDHLGLNEAAIELEFRFLGQEDSNAVVMSNLDGEESTFQLNNGKATIITTPGDHSLVLQIEGYEEIISYGLHVESQHRAYYHVYMSQHYHEENITLKPVIYLYPEKETEVSIELDIDGTNPFYYPEYNNGWTVTAREDGRIEHDGSIYNYLFWEANQEDQLSRATDDLGFCVKGNDAVSFLEGKLNEVGFTSEEKADFITFWGPKIAMSENNFVRFEWNSGCDKFAELNITPKPDNIYRLYILISPISTEFDVKPQVLPKMDRSGFTVIEWGGQYSNTKMETSL